MESSHVTAAEIRVKIYRNEKAARLSGEPRKGGKTRATQTRARKHTHTSVKQLPSLEAEGGCEESETTRRGRTGRRGAQPDDAVQLKPVMGRRRRWGEAEEKESSSKARADHVDRSRVFNRAPFCMRGGVCLGSLEAGVVRMPTAASIKVKFTPYCAKSILLSPCTNSSRGKKETKKRQNSAVQRISFLFFLSLQLIFEELEGG
jgi:hypothetical protein